MPVLVILIIISLSLYVYYKVKYVRSTKPIEKKWLSSKSSIALGLFVGLFGINTLFLYQSLTTYIVGPIFIIIGFLSAWAGYKAYKHYHPFVLKEMEE